MKRTLMSLSILILAGCSTTLNSSPVSQPAARQTAGNLVTEGVPPVPPAIRERVRQYSNARSARLLDFVGDDLLVSTRFGQTSQVHRVAGPGQTREQLTFFKEPVANVAVPPVASPEGFIFGRDVGGAEFYQLFWFDFASGRSRLLTDGRSRYGSLIWNRDGTAFAYSTTERDGVHHDVHLGDLQGNKRVVYESETGFWLPLDFSPDGQRLLLLKYLSINESELYEADMETGSVRRVLNQRAPVAIGAALYAADGRSALVLADLGGEFMRLHRLTLDRDTVTPLGPTRPHNVEDLALSRDGTNLAYAVNEDGLSKLYVHELNTGRERAHDALPQGVVGGLRFDETGSQLGLTLSRPTAPADAYSLDIESGALTRWTFSESGGLSPSQFVAPELFRYPTFDQVDGAPRTIPAFLFRPEGSEPKPVIILIHGGPEGQYRPYLSSTVQYLVGELGYAVIAPNVRGSSGYGKSYLKLDNGRLREDSVRDIGALLDWIADQPGLDKDRVVVYGGSYGGYMVLASLVKYADRLAAGVESVGISNFVTFLENTQPYRQDLRRTEYGDERDPKMRAFLESISPLNQTDQMQRPLLIMQGANDPRVPASESEQILNALKDRGIPVWYLLALDEGHGFRKKRNREYSLGVMGLFLEQFIAGER